MTGKKVTDQPELRETDGGVLISVRASPGAARDKVLGIHANALKIATTAPALEGKANKALCRMISKKLGIKRSLVSLHSGKTSRNKCFLLNGISLMEAAKFVDKALLDAKKSR